VSSVIAPAEISGRSSTYHGSKLMVVTFTYFAR
jgi:hypothetical protein